MTAADVGMHRRASNMSRTQPMGRNTAVGRRRASSVVPNNSPVHRSRKYQPAGNGPPSKLSACHQFPEFAM